ncbi:hypothetical protein BCR36DRAFT_366036 [Piromyces finnis]|uniref:Uncharacterized protein n=1 Tax=Piromyces finnis TaxID=1754191 RepID=A0A1Y1VM83_9FUNG|nr:hypothetical protein BCR36DRAFT_366036 [Piromyces finnis]|eukprot:ORX60036.1 hypothetical protein BCR36DRAFT_366036 [Piromyces finnis]
MSTNSNAYKSIFNNKDKKDVGVGKDEFLARRRFFLEMAQNESKNAKKSFSPSHVTNRYTSNLKPEPKFRPIKSTSSASFSRDPSSNASNKTSSSKTTNSSTTNLRPFITKISDDVPKTLTGSAGFSAPKSNSLKNILSQVGRNNQFVSNDEFRSRRKAFEDAQTNDITQLLPRPLTPSGYCYYGRSSPLLGGRPWSPASERPWSPAYERHGSPTPSFDSERSFGASEVRLPWERPTQTKKSTTPAKEEKKVFTNPAVPGSPALSATPITSDEPMAIPITNDIIITPPPAEKSNDDLLNEKIKMWYSKVDEEIEKEENIEINKVEE